MTILQVCAYAAPYEGNFITSLKALAKKAAKKGHETIYAFPETAREKDWCKALGESTDVYFLPLAKARIKPATYSKLKKIYKAHPDLGIIHCHFELYDIPVVMTAKKHVKVFWHLHDPIDSYNDSHNKLMYKIQYGLFHKKATLLSVSEKYIDYIKTLGFPEKQTRFFPNALALERINQVSKNYNEREYDFLLFGWDYERKGVDLCIEAYQKLNMNLKIGIVAGENTINKIEAQYGPMKGIEIIEPTENVNELYSKTRAFLQISRNETFSYALLEAIYSGLPSVCTDTVGTLWAKDFSSVTMVKSGDVDSIANGMRKVLERGSLLDEIIMENRRQVEDRYSIDMWADRLLIYYGIE